MHAEFLQLILFERLQYLNILKQDCKAWMQDYLNHKHYNETNKVNIRNMRIPL